MSKIEKFEDIIAWQKARGLVLDYNSSFLKDYSFTDQIRRSSGSVMDNMAEGFERGGNKEFIQFLYISKGLPAKVKTQLYLVLNFDYITNIEFESTYELTNETSIMISGLIKYLSKSNFKGEKQKTLNLKL